MGETSRAYVEEPELSAQELEYPQTNPPEDLSMSSRSVVEIMIATHAAFAENCPNCPTLKKENRKLSNSVKTLREAAKK
jgi:hypothetical protein